MTDRSYATASTAGFGLVVLVLAFSGIHAADEQRIELPKPVTDGQVSVEAAIKQRRSVRDYTNRPLSLADVGQLLWAAQGVTSSDGGRAAPSAGALYPLEIYLVAGRVDSLPAGVYRYVTRRHQLEPVVSGDLRRELASAALNQAWIREAPMTLVITGVYERTAAKYGARARRYVQIEAGHAAQNVYLQAAARDLGTVMVGAFHDADVQQALGIPSEHAPLALMPVGHPRWRR